MYVDHGYTYEYDGNGNITTKKTYAYTTGTLAEERRYKEELTTYITLKFYYDGERVLWRKG